MKKALVIVSFGTTYERARRSIDAVERARRRLRRAMTFSARIQAASSARC